MRLYELRKNQKTVGKKTGMAEAVDYLLSLDAEDRKYYFVSSSMTEKLGIKPTDSATGGTAPLGIYAFSAEYFLSKKKSDPDAVLLEALAANPHIALAMGRGYPGDVEPDYDYEKRLPYGEGFKYINVFRLDPGDLVILSKVNKNYLLQKVTHLQEKYPSQESMIYRYYSKTVNSKSPGTVLYNIVWNLAEVRGKSSGMSDNYNVISNSIFRSIGIKAIYSTQHHMSILDDECAVLDPRVIKDRKLFVNSPEHILAIQDPIEPEHLDGSTLHIRSINPAIALDKVLKKGKKIPHTEVAIARSSNAAEKYVTHFLIPNGLKWDSPEHEKKWPTSTGKRAIDSPISAFTYARDAIKGRWPAGEKVIASDPRVAYRYANEVIKDRWPEAEKVIASDPYTAYEYARDVIQGRWPASEKAIASDPQAAFWYATEVIKDPDPHTWDDRIKSKK